MLKRAAFLVALLVTLILFSGVVTAQDSPTIAVLTPYLAQPGTQFMVEGFQAAAEERGWTVKQHFNLCTRGLSTGAAVA